MILIISLLSLSILLLLAVSIDKFIIPTLNQDSIIRKWWEKHISCINPYEK
jgi:hypothetical protein